MAKYNYRVIWSEPDQEYVGTCLEFPSLSWLAGSQGEALEGIMRLVAEVLEEMAKADRTGEPAP
jgi:predicted RNase H-like HicB family nuclease